MMPSDPNKTKTEQTISNGGSNSHGADKVPKTSPCKIECNDQTQQPYYGWNLRRTTPYQRANIAIMILIFIVTGTYAVFSYLQWDVLQSTLKLDQRAWMGITHIVATGEIGKPKSISIGFKNTGKTPAKYVNTIMTVDVIKWDAEPDFANIKHSHTDSREIVAPQQPITNTYDFTEHPEKQISDTQTLGIISGSMRVVVYGIVTYEDIFGIHHWIKYCSSLTGDGKTFSYYHKHNDTDND